MPHRVTALKRVEIVLRITHSGSIKLANLDLEGKLIGPWVDEVRAIVANLRIEDVVCLNLERLSFADSNGIALLTELRRSGVQLSGCTPLIEGMLGLDQRPKNGDSTPSQIPGHTHE